MKPKRRKKASDNSAFAPRAIEGDPEVYTRDELETLIHYGLQYGRGLQKARQATHEGEDAERFRRRLEIINIFRGLPQHLRRRPTSQDTKDVVLLRLEQAGFSCSETTFNRDYKALGGAKFFRGTVPFAPGEDKSSPLSDIRSSKPKSSSC